MSFKALVPYSNDNREGDRSEDGFELLDQPNVAGYHKTADIDNDQESDTYAPTSMLPARSLHHKSTTHVVRVAFWTSLTVMVLVISLCVLNYHVSNFLPDTSSSELLSSGSYDLTVNNGSALQNAVTINLRGSTHLSFAAAKAIDVMWQLFVGMGGRL